MAMAVSSQEQVEDEEQGEDQETRADRQEIRLGLVMNGGVSLAIWMGGVTVEINRLINRDPVYGDVLDLMNSIVRVDVIAGASAGGINGAMLAAMIAHDNDRATELHDPPPHLARGRRDGTSLPSAPAEEPALLDERR